MQHAESGDLRKQIRYLQTIRPSAASATLKGQLICDIIFGMRFVHSCKIIHRDLNPGNILVDGNGRGLLADFGLSRSLCSKRPPATDAITESYAAPEEKTGGECTEKVDVLSFGLVAYEIIEGNPPAPPPGPGGLPMIPRRFGALMQELLPLCWYMDPSRRPAFADILTKLQICGFQILDHADGSAIAQAAAKVLEMERALPKRPLK
jgi:serine/threonine protein kinase